jgi:hypothetical protein
MHDRAGYIVDPDAKVSPKTKGRIVCLYSPDAVNDFHKIAPTAPSVRPDGRVVPCCMDFGMRHILGNLITQSWEEIRNNTEFKAFYKSFDGEGDSLCRSCYGAVSITRLPAYRLKLLLQNKKNIEKDKDGILKKLASAPYVGIMGLGKIFSEHYFTDLWDEAFNATVFVDNDSSLWGKPIRGMSLPSKKGVVESPAELRKYPGIFVITFVGEDKKLAQQLDAMCVGRGEGVDHANIFEIYSLIK